MKLELNQTFSEKTKEEICFYLVKNELVFKNLIFSILKNIADYNLLNETLEFKTKYIWVIKLFKKFISINNEFDIQISISNLKTLKDKKTNYLVKMFDKNQDSLLNKIHFNFADNLDKQLFLIGAFLSGGSINDPSKNGYHLEIRMIDEDYKDTLLKIMNDFELNPKVTYHHNKWIIYFKKSNSISDVLKLMFANSSMFFLEDNRIEKDMVNNVQRLINLEVFNLQKISKAAVEQSKICEVIKSSFYYSSLSLKEKIYCDIRAEQPRLSMQKICDLMNKQLPKDMNITKGSLSHIVTKLKTIYQKI